MTTSVREASMEDVLDVAARLRPADHQETLAATGLPPEVLLPEALRSGRRMMVGLIFGRPEVLFGVDPVLGQPDVGIAWMVGTDAIDKNPIKFLRASRKIWDAYHDEFPFLTNFADARNTVHLRWLEWLGAVMVRRVERFGPHSQPFIEFLSICARLKQ
jgi:hypothetical protein